jgi:hypothetical protein
MTSAQPKRLLEPGKNPEDAQAWIDALEGPYADRKGFGFLHHINGRMCCLGVLADLNGADWSTISPLNLMHVCLEFQGDGQRLKNDLFGLDEFVQSDLITVNDESDTFAPVIAKIREFFIPEAKP